MLFSFGSLIKTASIPKYREEIIVNALSKLKQRVIWKYEDSDEEGTITGNIMRVRWIPQLELLSKLTFLLKANYNTLDSNLYYLSMVMHCRKYVLTYLLLLRMVLVLKGRRAFVSAWGYPLGRQT